jgi:hypothetical protein
MRREGRVDVAAPDQYQEEFPDRLRGRLPVWAASREPPERLFSLVPKPELGNQL